jgi:O-antigen/teichoic acid export membrane protein
MVGQVATLAMGAAVSQALVSLSAPLLTRLYGAADFGVFSVYSSVLAFCIIVASLRYELAIPLPVDDRSAVNLLAVAITITAIGVAALVLSLLGGHRFLVGVTGSAALVDVLRVLPLSVFTCVLFQSVSSWMIRKRAFGTLSRARAGQALTQVSLQLGGGALGWGPAGLALGPALSQLAGVAVLARGARLPRHQISPTTWPALMRRHRDFALYTTPTAIIDFVGLHAPLLIFAKYFSMEVVGFLALSLRVLDVPASVVGNATGQVFYRAAAEGGASCIETRRLVERTAAALLLPAIGVFSIVLLHGPFLFGLVFGPRWRQAGLFAQILAPWLMIRLVSAPLSAFVYVKGAQRGGLYFGAVIAAARVLAILYGGRSGSSVLALQLFSGCGVVLSIGYVGWILHLAGSDLISWLARLRGPLASLLVALAGCAVLNRYLTATASVALTVAVLGAITLVVGTRSQKATVG